MNEKLEPIEPTEKSWTEKLRCNLTPPEVAAKADECVAKMADLDEIARDRKAFMERTRGESKELNQDVLRLAREVRERAEYRDVRVREFRGFAENTISVVREDTNELVRERPMTPEERQVALFPRAVPESVEAPPEVAS